jgi:two-component system, cell cycle sensor histidine kinase and response regulator CckA
MLSPMTVLVVDDESSLRSLVARRLASEGYRVLEAGDGVEALEILQSPDTDVRLVITDIRMPRMDGYELADRIGERAKSPPIIFISGYGQTGVWLPGSVFAKPFSLEALIEEASRLLANGKPGPASTPRRRVAPT